MPTLRERVERALDSVDRRSGAIVCNAEGRLLAARAPVHGGCAVLIALDCEPFSYPDPAVQPRADARLAAPPEEPTAPPSKRTS